MEVINEAEAYELTDGIPHEGMVFKSLEDAWNFWKSYGAKMHSGNNKPDKRLKGTKEAWLKLMYRERKKWAKCYMNDEVTLEMRSTQLSEGFNKDLKRYLKWNMDFIQFFKRFESSLKEKREREIESDFEMRKKKPRIKVNVPILQQAASLYIPKVFEIFQTEWELSMSSFVKSKIEGQSIIEYNIGLQNFGNNSNPEKYFQVIANHTDQMVSCNCNKFKRWGILCGHALKVLDLMEIELLPEIYILKRWTQEARGDPIEDFTERTIVENPKKDALCRYRADSEEVFKFVDATADVLTNKVDEKMQNISRNLKGDTNYSCPVQQPDLELDDGIPENFTENSISFKKRSGRKGGKSIPSWTDKRPNKKTVQKPAKKKEVEKPAKKKGKTGKGKYEGESHKPSDNSASKKVEHDKSNSQVESQQEVPFSLLTPNLSSEFQDYAYVNNYMDILLGGSSMTPLSYSLSNEANFTYYTNFKDF